MHSHSPTTQKKVTYKDAGKILNLQYTKTMNLQSAFMLFWSLSSGFGIIFAILSWIYDLNRIKQDPFFPGFKGVVSFCMGTIIGITHYKLSTKCARPRSLKDDYDPVLKTNSKSRTNLEEFEKESELQSIKINNITPQNSIGSASDISGENSTYSNRSNSTIKSCDLTVFT